MFGNVARAAVVLSLLGLFAAGCGPFGPSQPTICDPGQRSELLKLQLIDWAPSPAFTLKKGSTAWIQLTRLPESDEGLFGAINGLAEVHWVRSGVAPNLTTDPDGTVNPHDPLIIIYKSFTWQRLALTPGDWQLYAYSDPGIEVVSCPA